VARRFARAAGFDAVAGAADCEIGGADVVLVGRGACGERGDLYPARLAEEIGAALVYEVLDVRLEPRGLLVDRDLGRGARDVLVVRGRAVLLVAEGVARGPYVSRYRIHAAASESAESAVRRAPGELDWEPVTPRVRLRDHAARIAGSAVERMNALFGVGGASAGPSASLVRGSAESCARQLIRYLSHHAFVERGVVDEREESATTGAISQPSARGFRSSETDAAAIPIRLRRRPRLLHQRTRAVRGPFQLGVDI
jgi:hypothetical protein